MLPTLGTAMSIDRAAARRSDAAFVEGLRNAPAARFMVLADQKPVVVSNDERTASHVRWFAKGQLEELGLPVAEAMFLGVDRADGAGCFAVAVSEHRVRNAPGSLAVMRPIVDLRSLAMQGVMPGEELSLVGLAKALSHWHERSRCCGHCGGTTLVKDGGWKRKCWACGQEHFPRVDPVVIMLVIDRAADACLLGQAPRFDAGMYSALAGFIEPGEGVEEAVRRETLEEAGIDVGTVKFHSAQPWPFPHSLMLGCIAEARTTDIVIDKDELTDARWFERAELRQMIGGTHPSGLWVPGRQAIARTLMEAWVEAPAGA